MTRRYCRRIATQQVTSKGVSTVKHPYYRSHWRSLWWWVFPDSHVHWKCKPNQNNQKINCR